MSDSTRRTRRRKQSIDARQVLLRLPVPLLDCLDASATNGYRSRNAEVIRILENYFADSHGVIVHPMNTRPQVNP